MAKFNANTPQPIMTVEQKYERQYNSAKGNILLIIVFSVINGVLLAVNSGTYFLFTAWVPYLLIYLGMYLTGKLPVEHYEGDLSEYSFLNSGVLAVLVGAAAVIVLMYLICWLFARKAKVGGLIAALVLLVIDTGIMFWWCGFSADMIMDIVFHVWMVVSMISGIIGYFKLKQYQKEHPVQPFEPTFEQPTFDVNNGFNYNDYNNYNGNNGNNM